MLYRKRVKVNLRHIFGGYVRRSFSQQKQDRWISDIVFPDKKEGFFVEVGAHDGISISNTYYLEKFKGWKGILVEPNPRFYEEIEYARDAELEKCAVSEKNGLVEFIPDGAVGRIDGSGDESESIKVEAKTLERVLDKKNAPEEIDYLSVDVEGHEEKVFSNFPISGYNFLSVSVESPSKKLRHEIEMSGYTKILEIPKIDCIYIKNEIKDRVMKNFTRKNWSYMEFKINGLIENIGS